MLKSTILRSAYDPLFAAIESGRFEREETLDLLHQPLAFKHLTRNA
jgi:hypothetical protein